MKKIVRFLSDYLRTLDQRVFALSFLLLAIGVFVNYYFGLNHRIRLLSDSRQYLAWYAVFAAGWWIPLFALLLSGRKEHLQSPRFLFLMLLAPLLFSWKMVFDFNLPFSADAALNAYWNHVLYWPMKLALISAVLYLIWRTGVREKHFYGATLQGFEPKPYWLMLLIMMPLIAAASTQPDFLHTYPKLKHIAFLPEAQSRPWQPWVFELGYGSDFVTIGLFFRGFLVLGLSRWLGKDAILPMACFYCTIHFGKPLGECISSFFGGLILGVVTYHTRTIFGGLMVHLGIAWLMELGGYLGGGMR